MKFRFSFPAFLTILLILYGISFAQRQNNLFQYSVISALMEGNYDGDLSIKELKEYGDFGLGTLNNLDGELVILDGIFYQVNSEGEVRAVPDETKITFAVITFFEGNESYEEINESFSFKELSAFLETKTESENLIYAFRISGDFNYLKTRSIPAQQKPYKKLVEVTKTQPVFEFENINGTLIGFRFPSFMDGVNVPGYHFHFISADKKSGGHVLDLKTEKIFAESVSINHFNLKFPSDKDYLKADLSKRNIDDLQKAEK